VKEFDWAKIKKSHLGTLLFILRGENGCCKGTSFGDFVKGYRINNTQMDKNNLLNVAK
jgi:hypothetical protein